MRRLTDHEYHMLHHAIGAPEHQAKCDYPYRNSYVVDPPDEDCERLVRDGFMRRGRLFVRMQAYHVTAEGVEAVRTRLPRLKAWAVETEYGVDVVYAATRSAARAHYVRGIQDGWDCTWLQALRVIRSVRLAPGERSGEEPRP